MSDEWPHHKADNVDEFIEGQAVEILRLRAENEKLRDMLLRSDKLTRQEWYDMRNTQLAHESNADAYMEAGDD